MSDLATNATVSREDPEVEPQAPMNYVEHVER